MGIPLMLYDETMGGDKQAALRIEVTTARLTVRDLIRRRVYQEVLNYNTHRPDAFHTLVQPTDAEQTLNGYRFRQPRTINWETQYHKALEAFKRQGFLILVDDRQVEDLDEEIEIHTETQVSFLKLIPLVGG